MENRPEQEETGQHAGPSEEEQAIEQERVQELEARIAKAQAEADVQAEADRREEEERLAAEKERLKQSNIQVFKEEVETPLFDRTAAVAANVKKLPY